MSELLGSKMGGGSGFTTKFASTSVNIAVGTTADTTITPPADQKVRLTGLSSAGATMTNLVTISVGGVPVLTGGIIQQTVSTVTPTSPGDLMIGFGFGNVEPIEGDIGEAITFSTNVAFSDTAAYTYQFGV
tara:strand:- start:192 stop:584 length:393 start_codon:yes stop_codon:yes gene_type:complete